MTPLVHTGLVAPAFPVVVALPGWELFWAHLAPTGAAEPALATLRATVAEEARDRHDLESLAQDPTVGALRKLFKAAGTDPSRYRPSSEALLRRVLKGDELPAIGPLVDLNNCLSVRLAVPCCVMDETALAPPFELRAGRAGEAYESLRGPFELAGRPLLVDAKGPCDTPITGNVRVKVGRSTTAVWLVAYLPAGAVRSAVAVLELDRLLGSAGVATRGPAFASA